MGITLTEKAIKEIKRVTEEQKISLEDTVLEVGVEGGGCSGLNYKLGFKKRSELDSLNETVCNFDGLDAVVSNRALTFIEGTEIDFHDGLDKRGFVFRNSKATRSCGCGNSFSVE